MKKLVIIRHAKSSWDEPFLNDHERPLAERGLKDAPKMAKRLKKENIFPDAILSSDAERAKATAIIMAEVIDFPPKKIQFNKELYHGSVAQILSEIKKTDESVKTLFLFGHNPGLNDLIWKLGGEIDNLPTAGQFGFKFDVKKWEEISPKNAKIWFFDYPKKD
ncbi:SixA phosphatase family protein [Cognataquiflexum rubidum]|uniref:SixA phosphatase family protein n=1 Tax=Cognataquiflexum rubidum TaxID=2922273 RepID=UPI001F147514|nr:histidine phosphatase family protein [Cognataquiflexum rubidum]MCH6232332.1 histidine phosphatase family protein [Cognataquiflexum rubidum]